MAWTSRTDYVVGQIRSYLGRMTDAHTRAQVEAWVRAWDDVAPDLEDALNELVLQASDGRVRRLDVINSVRLQRALETIQSRLADLVEGSAAQIVAQLGDVVDYSGAMQERLIVSQLPPAAAGDVAGWSRVSPDAMQAIVTRSTERITKASFPLSDEATAAMRRELVRGIAVGDGPRSVAARMLRRTEGLFNGGLSRALTIARTEMLDAHRAAAALSDQANADTLTGWVWTCALSSTTCSACWSMHGREFPLDQAGPLGHQNCRCFRVPKTKTWRELGFDIDEPPSLIPDASTVFASLGPGQQQSILGPSRYLAWQNGTYPMSGWATKRTTAGWRDSWVPSKAPAA